MEDEIIENNVKKIHNIKKIIPILIEIFFSVILAYSIYKIYYIKRIEGNFDYKYIVAGIISLVSTIVSSYYFLKNNKDNIEKLLICFAIPIGMLYVFFMSPGFVPDEHAHIWKSYEISTGKLVTEIKENGTAPVEVPDFFVYNMIPYCKTYEGYEKARNKTTNYEKTMEIETSAQSYPFILYIPSSLAFFIGRILSINGIFVIYLARILNFLFFIFIMYYSIKIIPIGKKILGVILFFPMTMQQAASVSADCFVNAVVILFISYTLYLYKKNKEFSNKEKTFYFILGLLVGISKIAYVPVIGLSLLFIKIKNNKKIKNIYIVFFIAVTCIISLGCYLGMQKYEPVKDHKVYLESANVNSSEQIKSIISEPTHFIKAILYGIKDGMYIEGMIGKELGWRDIVIPSLVMIIFIGMLILSPFLEKNEELLKNINKLLILFVFLATYFLVIMALYIAWTPVGSDNVAGMQGRYLIPIIILPLICLCKKNRYIEINKINYIMPVLFCVLNGLAIMTVGNYFIR